MTDATWSATPGSGVFNTAGNWVGGIVPDGIASFGTSSIFTGLSFSASTSIGGWTFLADAPAYTFTVAAGRTLEFTGAGIAVDGGSAAITNLGIVEFANSSSAGEATINTFIGGATHFNGNSSAGEATLNNIGGGETFFNNDSSAGEASISNNGNLFFNGDSTADEASIISNGITEFNGNSTAEDAVITNNFLLRFQFNSTAGEADITTANGATIIFLANSSGGNAKFTTLAGGTFDLSNPIFLQPGTTAGSIAGAGNYLLGAKSLTVGSNGLSTEVSGVISGTGGSLVKVGDGTLTLSGTNTYTGTTTVNGGILQVDGSIAASSGVFVNNGGTLGGDGVTGAVTVNAGGILAPGASAGILGTGALTFAGGSTFDLELGGEAPGTEYDRLQVTGTVSLGGAALDLSLIDDFSLDAQTKTSFLIIDNDGSDAISGTFAGLAEGKTKVFEGRFFTITYKGGDGNDVVLTSGGARINGTASNDTVNGNTAPGGEHVATNLADTIDGKGGNDKLFGLGGNDTIRGGAGNDKGYGGKGNDKLYGDAGNDKLYGEAGNDQLYGGAGSDKFYGGKGNDKFYGQGGKDYAYFSKAASAYTITQKGNKTTVKGPDGTDQLTGVEVLVFSDQTILV